jgi:hypothetical protein
MAQELKERFDAKWTPEPFSGCWLWIGNTDRKGYGQLMINKRAYSAHRLAWTFNKGEIPHGLCVLHKCDTPACVRPDHLFLGNQRDNIHDCIAKGRFNPGRQKGEINGQAKLSEDQVKLIRNSALSSRVLGRQFGMSHSHIRSIKQRKSWSHL